MVHDQDELQTIRNLTLENQRLLSENNQLLKKMNRRSVVSFWFRVMWTLILIGAPFVLYYYVIEPYFESWGSSFEAFKESLEEVPGWKQFYESAKNRDSGGE